MTDKKEVGPSDLPLLKAALICETVIQRADGVLSLINIVDQRNITQQGRDLPQEMPEHAWEFHLVLMFVSGIYVGKASLAVSVQSPDGLRKPIHSAEHYFEGAARGVNAIFQLQFTFKTEGLYWFEIYVNDRQMTRVPMRILYNRMSQVLPPP